MVYIFSSIFRAMNSLLRSGNMLLMCVRTQLV